MGQYPRTNKWWRTTVTPKAEKLPSGARPAPRVPLHRPPGAAGLAVGLGVHNPHEERDEGAGEGDEQGGADVERQEDGLGPQLAQDQGCQHEPQGRAPL